MKSTLLNETVPTPSAIVRTMQSVSGNSLKAPFILLSFFVRGDGHLSTRVRPVRNRSDALEGFEQSINSAPYLLLDSFPSKLNTPNCPFTDVDRMSFLHDAKNSQIEKCLLLTVSHL